MTSAGLATDFLPQLATLHAAYSTAEETRRGAIRDEYFALCHRAWAMLSMAPLRTKMAGRENRRHRLRQIQAADAESGLRNLRDAWLSYFWEDLPGFLAEPADSKNPADSLNPEKPGDPADPAYLGRLIRFLGRTHDRAAYNLLTQDYGHTTGRRQQVSLDEPLGVEGDDPVTLGDRLPDRRPFKHDPGVFTSIHGAVNGWVRDRTARRPHRRGVYEAIGFAWWRHRVLGESVPALLNTYGPRLCRQDYLRECFEQLSAKVQRTLHREGYEHTPEGARLPGEWRGHRLPGDNLDKAA